MSSSPTMSSPHMMCKSRKATPNELKLLSCNLEKIKNKEINEGCCINIPSLDPRITQPFREIGWDAILDIQGPIHEHPIREFYASFSYTPLNPELQVHFQLNSLKYSMSSSEFGKLLGLPSTGARYFHNGTNILGLPNSLNLLEAWTYLVSDIYGSPSELKTPLSSIFLKIPFVMQYEIIRQNLCANEHFNDRIQAHEFAFLWHLQTKSPCDITNFVIHRMKNACVNPNRELPYGMLLNSLFYKLEIAYLGIFRPPTYRIINDAYAQYKIDKAMHLSDNTRITRLMGYESEEESSADEEEEESNHPLVP